MFSENPAGDNKIRYPLQGAENIANNWPSWAEIIPRITSKDRFRRNIALNNDINKEAIFYEKGGEETHDLI